MLRDLAALLIAVVRPIVAGRVDAPPPQPLPTQPEALYEQRRVRQQDIEKSVQVDIHRALINSTLEFIRGMGQVVSGVTGILLSTYVALLVGFRRETGFEGWRDWLLALAPAIFWLASLVSAYLAALASPRYDLVVLDLRAAMETYAQVVRSRKHQLILPSALALGGLIAFACVFNSVFVSGRKPASTQQTQQSISPASPLEAQPATPPAAAPSDHKPGAQSPRSASPR
jgi:hypothetical protein